MEAKYLGIIEDIKDKMANGLLTTGSKLPSVRQLAEQFSCSKNTVIRAYNELEKEHFIFSIPKSGYYVVNKLEQPTTSQYVVDFLSAGPDKTIMPYIEFQHCINQAIDIYKEELFSYSDQQGLYSLRVQITKYLQSLQVFTDPDRLFIVSGSQQALHLLVSMPFPNGKSNILIEQPTYFGFIESVHLHQATTFGIDLTMEGIDLERLEYIFRNNDIKFFYIVPRFQNPLGHSYTNAEKRKIVELAEKYDVYIVEDDFLGDLDPDSKSDPLFAYNPSGRIIYIKSFSKVFLPGLRVATVVLPTIMMNHFLRYKFSADFNSAVLSQGALDIYLKSGMFNSHIKTIKALYVGKMKALQEACESLLPSHTNFTKPVSGFYLSIVLPDNVSAKQTVHLLKNKNIFMDDASRMFLPEFKRDNLIRLSISQVDEQFIHHGIEELAQCISSLERKKPYPNTIHLL
ncbi:PLP-dependent aminotransferase family protein [Lysinibacillus irui]|uniref:PLP-dependent aminotransferase family protein n=1 Tax=Lysinibacillus irui TaxID=2998077 RepID=A0ABU5NJ11_9BACI|nr:MULTISPECIES: PLP-dependent aminotransferase family protein [Lysinibacillus]MEA0553623.1 PLP-dependent aminotransferase family protein [Lysinibacillus irui]MEA0564430.1 PLP-dependent aminotransferase family protein [Lysinibacillus irui]MEA0976007.1 PLP-dependent aminotransferase family protein [Lysinibacillus irui]MEA1042161.1 PLP-dependent aminotransferase family protein [Lysinibacillus irui]